MATKRESAETARILAEARLLNAQAAVLEEEARAAISAGFERQRSLASKERGQVHGQVLRAVQA